MDQELEERYQQQFPIFRAWLNQSPRRLASFGVYRGALSSVPVPHSSLEAYCLQTTLHQMLMFVSESGLEDIIAYYETRYTEISRHLLRWLSP